MRVPEEGLVSRDSPSLAALRKTRRSEVNRQLAAILRQQFRVQPTERALRKLSSQSLRSQPLRLS